MNKKAIRNIGQSPNAAVIYNEKVFNLDLVTYIKKCKVLLADFLCPVSDDYYKP